MERHMAEMCEGHDIRFHSTLLAALDDFRHVADFFAQHEPSNTDVKSFYQFLFFRCWLFRQSLNAKTNSSSIRNLIEDALDRLNSLIVHPSASCESQSDEDRAFPGLEKLHCLLATRFDDTRSKHKALRDCIVFGDKEEQFALLEMLSEACKAAQPETQTRTSESELASPRKRRQRPRDDVQSAAHSLFRVLRTKCGCTCEPVHKYVVQLSLGTHRAQVNSCDFDLYFGLEKTWQEARVQTGTLTRSRASIVSLRHHPKVEHNDRPVGNQVQRRLVRQLCKDIMKTTKQWPDYRLNFALEKDDLWKLQSKESDLAIDKSKLPVSLAQLLANDLTLFNERVKRILSVLLGYAVLHLHDTLWLSPTWGSDNVMFLRSTDGLPMRPYIRTSVDQDETTDQLSSVRADDEDEDDFDPDDLLLPPYPCLMRLAIVLMEIHKAAPFAILSETYGVSPSDKDDLAAQFINARGVFRRCNHDFTDKTRMAIEACLDPKIGIDDGNLQSVIYQRIVLLLDDELEQGFSEFLVDKLDSIIQELDLENGGQRMLRMRSPSMASRGSTITQTRSSGSGISSRPIRLHVSTSNKNVQKPQNNFPPLIESDTSNDQRQSSEHQMQSTNKAMTSNSAFIEASRNFVAPSVPKKPPDDRPNTLRIMNIPDNMSSVELCETLKQHFAFECKIHSLARASRDMKWKKHATVTFPRMTNSMLDATIERLQHLALKNIFEFDKNFLGLTPLYDGGNSTISDIIAIEGLGTNPFGTFRAPTGDLMWLRDFLPQSFPCSRILLYGYDSKVPNSQSNQTVPEIASTCKNIVSNFRRLTKTEERPIIWLGQSMGGLIIQEVLVQASKNRLRHSSGNLLDQTIGFLGYGVPINGLQHESLLDAVKMQPNRDMIRSICLDEDGRASPYLERLANEFAECTKDLSIHHFYETNPSPDIWVPRAMPQRRVDHKEAVGRGNRYWVSRNHSDLVKVPSKTDIVYITTEQVISLIHWDYQLQSVD